MKTENSGPGNLIRVFPGGKKTLFAAAYLVAALLALWAGLMIGSELAVPCRGEVVEGMPWGAPAAAADENSIVRVTPDGYLVSARRLSLCGELAYVRTRDLEERTYLYPNRFRAVVIYRTLFDGIVYGR